MEMELSKPLIDEQSVFEVPDSQDAITKASQNGWEIVFPQANQLQIDIDGPVNEATYNANITLLSKLWKVKSVEVHVSKSHNPRRKHITITLEENVDELTRIAMQAALGDDGLRVLFGLIRLKNGDPHPTLFFELPKVYLGSPEKLEVD